MSKSTTTWVVNLKDSNFNDPKYNKIFCHLNIFNVSFQKKFMKKGNITISINIKTFYFEPVNITYPHTHTHTHTHTDIQYAQAHVILTYLRHPTLIEIKIKWILNRGQSIFKNCFQAEI